MPRPKNVSSLTAAARLHQACADPTRLRVLLLLRDGELCVGDLVSLLGVPQPTASRHLAHLRRAGLVRARRRGLWMLYALAPTTTSVHAHLLDCVSACGRELPELRADRQRATRLRERGGCCPEAVLRGGSGRMCCSPEEAPGLPARRRRRSRT